MDKTTKIKEAVKLAFAFALVYGIALKINWISPSWAGWSVVAIAATSGGESLQKGLLRIWGTLLACVVGITIISLAAQDRWLFMMLTAGWLFFSSYKMLAGKERSYFWFCAAYVTLVITAAGPSSAGGFYIAVFRTIETILGIVVYTLIAVFIWPRTNIGSIKKSLNALLDTQVKLFRGIYNVFLGTLPLNQLKELGQSQVKQLGQYSKSIASEGSENYKVLQLKPMLDQFGSLNNNLMKSLDHLFGGMEDISNLSILQNQSKIDDYFKEINNRFAVISDLLSGKRPSMKMEEVKLKVNTLTQSDISHFDKAAVAILISELNKIEAITRQMVSVAKNIAEPNIADLKTVKETAKSQKKSESLFPIFDIEYLKGSFYVAFVVVFGFIIWFYVNPPGHASWYILGGVFALLFAGAQQVKTVKLVIPFVVAMICISLLYVFVLPKLTMFYQLGILLFACMFIIQYFLSGPATAVFTIALLQLLAIDNPQTYDASALVNGFLFISMLLIYLFGMSYLISSPRPEKAFLKLVSRFFQSTKYLVSVQSDTKKKTLSFYIQRYKAAFYYYELHSLPAKINKWGKAIDKKQFSNTDHEQIDAMVNTLQVIVVRMESLIEANQSSQGNDIIELSETISSWRQRLISVFDSWDNLTREQIKGNLSELVLKKMDELEEKLKHVEAKIDNKIDKEDGIQFYHLLGSYRGVTEAALSFVQVADKLDWGQWKEERFP